MKRSVTTGRSVTAMLILLFVPAGTPAAEDTARHLLAETGPRGGLIIHLGCGEGTLTGALGAGDCYTVHGLDSDPKKVAQARSYFQSKGLYGRVSAEHWTDAQLPYTANLVNLVIVQEPGKVPMREIMRVLRPGGVVCLERNGTWQTQVKPWPDTIDQWTHFLHDASNNAVADDAMVAPPESLQWQAGPLWLRSHTGQIEELAARGIALGVLEDIELEEREIDVTPGDILIFYTDGVTEAMDVDGQQFDTERLRQVLAASPGASAPAMLAAVEGALSAFTGDTPQSDDIALFVVRRRPLLEEDSD